MKNFLQSGETLTVAAPYDVTSGSGVKVGAIFGVASSAALSGAPVEITRRGVFALAKKSAQAWVSGAKVYWDDTAKEATTTATSNSLIGAACVDASADAAVGTIVLDGVVR